MSLQLVAHVYRCARCGLQETQRVTDRGYETVIHVCGPEDWSPFHISPTASQEPTP